jgi:hypothetical protein
MRMVVVAQLLLRLANLLVAKAAVNIWWHNRRNFDRCGYFYCGLGLLLG